jgi:hypothetical protein
MTLLSLTFRRSQCADRAFFPSSEGGHFVRQVFPGRALAGGVLTWPAGDGATRRIVVAMTWDVLAQLRNEAALRELAVADDAIIRAVLSHWGVLEYRKRLASGMPLPAEGLLLGSLGGPRSPRAGDLLTACGLLRRSRPARGKNLANPVCA